MPDQLAFPTCALPGCPLIVAIWGDVCTQCRNTFGDYLNLAGTPMTEDAVAARDRGVRDAYAIQREVIAGGR